ncbi:(2Fe-2S)-binding protein [Algibacillus agarilyticus]|uniref:(2Fe-2S)-binding protein n=1 Tax=Algibacillus agarilyticus TaxID=2234133 RepID=UPI000DD03E1D|nr:(2Fe-2S)-binding protein [Algibacillus agarilyticus]
MITLNVNNQDHQIDAPDEMPLLWAIRDLMQYTGTKFGCGKGLCGACTVHINGQPIRSCITPVALAKNSKIKTIEGVSDKGDHVIQIAWQENNVPQCGYCQSGQIMNALPLIERSAEKNTTPTDEEIDNHMAGNICRCGTYPRIKQAIKDATVALIKGA